MARVYADVNQHMPKSYWEYDSVNITWGALENYEVVRKIGPCDSEPTSRICVYQSQVEANTQKCLKGSMS